MIKRVVLSFIFVDLFIAIGVSLVWQANNIPTHQIQLGSGFLSLVSNTSMELDTFKIEIPNIPPLPNLQNISFGGEWYEVIVNLFINFVNGLFFFLNGLIRVINFLITIINYFIQLIEFIVLIIKNLITYKDTLVSQ